MAWAAKYKQVGQLNIVQIPIVEMMNIVTNVSLLASGAYRINGRQLSGSQRRPFL